jgi:hypothetical protein
MQEGFSLEHCRELIGDTLEELLDGSRVTNEGDCHLETTRSNVALSSEHVVRDPLDEVRRVFVLNILHLFLDLLHGDLSSEHSGDLKNTLTQSKALRRNTYSEVTAVSGVRGGHHVLSVEHLLSQFRHCHGTVLLTSTGGQWSETNHEEVKTGEWNQVDSHFTKVRVELTGEL